MGPKTERENVDRLDKEDVAEESVERVMAIVRELGSPPASATSDHCELYDQEGLPG
ncbi:hypothetical protein J2R99_001021 [Rhodopseudomonas julia]|uniref:Uncharacterized protein n=1 Tax=Rhodopseudomonas julia TaxID=200617 RepID=A0ABU0C4M2_9BRAD|nr:hypothetical protein [Rhodopseudomonas julia]MDQ0325172.1 hypothetical protein [Rhodopseudomonas julia]